MSEPRIVTPEEARDWLRFVQGNAVPGSTFPHGVPQNADVAHTVATEPDRIRAAVVKALEEVHDVLVDNGELDAAWVVWSRLHAIQREADL